MSDQQRTASNRRDLLDRLDYVATHDHRTTPEIDALLRAAAHEIRSLRRKRDNGSLEAGE